MRIWLDCDGVLADFDGAAFKLIGKNARDFEKEHGPGRMWAKVYSDYYFFRNLPVIPDAHELVEGVKKFDPNPRILTGLPSGGLAQARDQKQEWKAEHFPELEMITCMSKDKRNYCQPGDVLIDDWAKYLHLWEGAGGTFITHFSAHDSLLALDRHLLPYD